MTIQRFSGAFALLLFPVLVFPVLVAAFVLGTAPLPVRAQETVPTFSKDVAPIFFANCTTCHRPGEMAPMSLLTYKDARPWARSIAARVSSGAMPPWHADPANGQFQNERRLSEADRDIIVRWANGGAPEGRSSDLPPQPAYTEGWQMGQPDAIFSMREDYPIPASGTIEYKFFEVPTDLAEDKWVQAVEIRPGSRAVVHHVIVYMRSPQPEPRVTAFRFAPGMNRPADQEQDRNGVDRVDHSRGPANDRPAPKEFGAWLGGYAPGQPVRLYQPGTAIRLPKGAVLTVAMHYTANGVATTDRTRVGVIFAKAPPKTEVRVVPLQNQNLTLPPGASDTRVDAEMTVQQDVWLWSALPHTHVRGKRWEVSAIYPDGRTAMILSVPKYDFNWQTDYVFKQPLKLPKGTKIRTSAWYDNSVNNRANPDPTAEVHWGDQTWEEMQFTAFTYSLDDQPARTVGQF